MKDWIPAPEAELVRRTEKGILLRLRSGREEWFPRSGVVQTDEGWFVAGWLAESRRKSKVDTSCMRPRAGSTLLPLLLILAVTLTALLHLQQTQAALTVDLATQAHGAGWHRRSLP